jgi:hypothetical protein
VFITPDLCSDAHDEPCVDGRPGGLVSADDFLKEWVPRITRSPAYLNDGLLIVTYDESETDGENSTACCDEPTGPNTPQPGIFGPGGGRTGTLLLSPFIRGGTANDTPYNHYSMLRSVEDIFGLPYLGYAGREGLKAFGDDVYHGAPPTVDTPPLPPPKPKPQPPRAVTVSVGRRTVPGCRSERARRGRLIAKVVTHGRELVVLPRVRGRLTIRAGSKSLVSRRRVRACHAYGIMIPRPAARRVTVQVRSGRLTQRRVARRR